MDRTGRYPVVDVANSWELRSMLELTVPGVELAYEELDLPWQMERISRR
ncbi:hypothetical protein [Streptomyces sp. NPDC048428]